ncbi:MAG: transposase [Phycisphaeraceae bacterium]
MFRCHHTQNLTFPGGSGEFPERASVADHPTLGINRTRKCKQRYDRQRYKHRNVIERFFRRIKQCRRIATRYEKKPQNFAAFVWLAAGLTAGI